MAERWRTIEIVQNSPIYTHDRIVQSNHEISNFEPLKSWDLERRMSPSTQTQSIFVSYPLDVQGIVDLRELLWHM